MISVCIPTYNGEMFIKQQIESILRQIDVSDEIIISDDSSSDKTVAIIESFKDSRIKLIKNNNFRSPIFNLENALKHAKGDYVFLSDQDDIWHDKKVEITVPLLNKYNTVVSDCIIIDEKERQISTSYFEKNNSKPGLVSNLFKNSYLGCCMAFDRKILNAALPFPKKIAMHDIWLGLITELIGHPLFINDKLISYRRHTENFSSTTQSSQNSLLYKITYRVQFIYFGFLRYLRIKFKRDIKQ